MTTADPTAVPLKRLLRGLGSDASRRAYEGDWVRYRTWLAGEGVEVTAARPRHVEDHINYLQSAGCARSTCGRALSVIRAVYAVLVRDELMDSNPAREVRTPKFDSTPKTPYLTEDKLRELLAAEPKTWREKRDHLCVCLLAGIGWRREEVADLRVEDFRDGAVTGVVKGKKTITVGVPPWLQAKVDEWVRYAGLGDRGPLLPRSPNDVRPISGDIVYKIVTAASAQAGAKISPHGLRRTFITISGQRGVPLKERQLSVGHSSSATTERYDRAREAAQNAPGAAFTDLAVGLSPEQSRSWIVKQLSRRSGAGLQAASAMLQRAGGNALRAYEGLRGLKQADRESRAWFDECYRKTAGDPECYDPGCRYCRPTEEGNDHGD